MSPQEVVRRGVLALAVVALSVLVTLSLSHTEAGRSFAQEAEGLLAIDCDTDRDGVQGECDVPSGAVFPVQINVTEPPADGYATIQVKLAWTGDVVEYQPAAEEADETLWEVCTSDPLVFLRFDNWHVQDIRDRNPSVVYSCLPTSVTTDPNLSWSDTGPIFQFSLKCLTDDAATLELIPRTVDGVMDSQEGTFFLIPDETSPTLTRNTNPETPATATVNCGGAASGEEQPEVLPETGGFSGSDAQGGPASGLWLALGALLTAAASGLIALGWRAARGRSQ